MTAARREQPPGGVPELVRHDRTLELVHLTSSDVELEWGPSPDAIDQPIRRVERSGGHVQFTDVAPPDVRPYVRVTDETGSFVAGERRLPLAGAPNARDLGGYRAADGRALRWGRIYRSGALHKLTDADLAYLEHLGVRLVVDLRRAGERADMPSRVTDTMEVVSIPIGDTGLSQRSIIGEINAGRIRGLGAPGAALVEANAAFVRSHAADVRQAVEMLSRAVDHPVLVHCTAGKDRAGFASASMLLALGVPEEVVVYDYLRTNDFLAEHVATILAERVRHGHDDEEIEIMRALLEVRPEYLGTALAAMTELHGSAAGFVRDGLGLDEPTTERWRTHLLEAVPAR